VRKYGICGTLLTICLLVGNPPAALGEARYFDHPIDAPMVFAAAYLGNAAEWIVAEGQITSDTPERFKDFLDKSNMKGVGTLSFHSNGGNLLAGIKLGEMIRQAGYDTMLGKTVGNARRGADGSIVIESTGSTPGVCASACAYAFLGGKKRHVPSGSKIGVHQHSDPASVSDPLAKSANALDRSVDQVLTGLVLEYVLRMGASPRVASIAQMTPPWKVYWLSSEEFQELEVDNFEDRYTSLSLKAFGRGAVAEVSTKDSKRTLRIYCRGIERTPQLAFLIRSDDFQGGAGGYRDTVGSFAYEVATKGGLLRIHPTLVDLQSTTGALSFVFALPSTEGNAIRNSLSFAAVDRGDTSRARLGFAPWMGFKIDGDRRLIDIAFRNCIE
jgi:hypothetical protein